MAYETVLHDTFTDTAGVPLDEHTPDVGTGWNADSEGASDALRIGADGQTLRCVGAGIFSVVDALNPSSAFEYVVSSGGEEILVVYTRYDFNGGSINGYRFNSVGGGLWGFWRMDAGSATLLDDGTQSISAGQTVRGQWSGNVFTATVNGVEVVNYDITPDATKHETGGMAIRVDLTIDPVITEFKAEQVVTFVAAAIHIRPVGFA